jgi:hypothetical protein
MRASAPTLAKVLPTKLQRSQTTNTILLATRYGGDKFKKVAMNAHQPVKVKQIPLMPTTAFDESSFGGRAPAR